MKVKKWLEQSPSIRGAGVHVCGGWGEGGWDGWCLVSVGMVFGSLQAIFNFKIEESNIISDNLEADNTM